MFLPKIEYGFLPGLKDRNKRFTFSFDTFDVYFDYFSYYYYSRIDVSLEKSPFKKKPTIFFESIWWVVETPNNRFECKLIKDIGTSYYDRFDDY